MKVHESVGVHSKLFLQKLRRVNYVTPKNYLDFIKTYGRLLEEKDKFVLEQVSKVNNKTSSIKIKVAKSSLHTLFITVKFKRM